MIDSLRTVYKDYDIIIEPDSETDALNLQQRFQFIIRKDGRHVDSANNIPGKNATDVLSFAKDAVNYAIEIKKITENL